MKLILVLAILLTSSEAFSQTHDLKFGQVYMGKETYNEHYTGNNCFITIQSVTPIPEKGLHCNSVELQFSFIREDIPKDILKVDSRITNYHRQEFPAQRTCAMNTNGSTAGDEIYREDSTNLYNQIFGGSHNTGSSRYDYFLTLSPKTKQAVRSRVHVTSAMEEFDVDCVSLEKM